MTLTTPMKIILAVVLIGVIMLGFFLLDWQKKMSDRTTLDQQIVGKQQEYDRIRNETKSLTTLVQENDQLNREYNELVRGKFGGKPGETQENPEAFVPDFITTIETVVDQVGVEKGDTGPDGFQIKSITPGGQVTGKDGGPKKEEVPSLVAQVLERFPKRKFNLQMQGRYDTLIDFLDKMGTLALNRLVTIDHISLSPQKGSELSIQLPLTAYLKGGQ
ncbi:MAG: type IV pilus inner membrane component PilO [Candidatus Xenobia bacterium]